MTFVTIKENIVFKNIMLPSSIILGGTTSEEQLNSALDIEKGSSYNQEKEKNL